MALRRCLMRRNWKTCRGERAMTLWNSTDDGGHESEAMRGTDGAAGSAGRRRDLLRCNGTDGRSSAPQALLQRLKEAQQALSTSLDVGREADIRAL
jgi:hypothetical protein